MTRLGDLLLTKLLGEASASAACPPSTYWEYRCTSGRRRQRRRCSTLPTCTITCTNWATFDNC